MVETECMMLTDAERQRLRPGLDLDALDRLLAHLTPSQRESVLRSLARTYDEREGPTIEASTPEPRFENRELQALLDAVWRPVYEAQASRHRGSLPAEWGTQSVAFKLVLVVAEKDAGPTGVRVVRVPQRQGLDIIALAPSRATAGDLAAGLHALMSWRQTGPVLHTESLSVPDGSPIPPLPKVLTQLLERSLSCAASEFISDVREVGKGRTVEASVLPWN
jgi:hypothetical protein